MMSHGSKHPHRASSVCNGNVVVLCHRKLPQHQLVIWADSGDVVWLPCGRDLRRVFKDFGHDIVIGSCDFQHPDGFKEVLFPDVPIVKPEIPFPRETKRAYLSGKYINAGVIMGRASALTHYLGGVFLRSSVVDIKSDFDDQS